MVLCTQRSWEERVWDGAGAALSLRVPRGLPSPPRHSNIRVGDADCVITGGHKSLCRLSNQAPAEISGHLGLHCMVTVSPAPSRCQGQIARPSEQMLNLMSCILIRVLHSTEVPGGLGELAGTDIDPGCSHPLCSPTHTTACLLPTPHAPMKGRRRCGSCAHVMDGKHALGVLQNEPCLAYKSTSRWA